MINSVNQGMQGLSHLYARENIDPNSKVVKVLDQTTGTIKLQNQALGPNFDAQSIKSDVSYQWSAVGEMNNAELD